MSEDIVEYLLRMGMTVDKIMEFMAQRMLLMEIEKERARKINLKEYYQRSSDVQNGNNFIQGPPNFPHYSTLSSQPDRFSKYVDYVLEKQKYNWQESMFRESYNDYITRNSNPQVAKEQRRRQLICELEQMDRDRFALASKKRMVEEERMNEIQSSEGDLSYCFKRREINDVLFDEKYD